MRRKRPFAVIAFASTEQALAAEAMFTQRGLPGRMIPIPSQVSAGCGLAWKAETSTVSKQLVALRSSASDNRLLRLYQNGSKTPENDMLPIW